LIARQFWRNAFKAKSIYAMMLVVAMILSYSAYSGWRNYTVQNGIRNHYQDQVRQSWENNPDKHPHRMAHYGSFAFRLKHPLSMFDFGMESFTGNAVFLEAHKQNTVNFSEASFSTGLLRFGEISMAMLLLVILPLIIFFLGFASVASERENGTLKVMLTQGAGWKEILIGKSLGLTGLSLLFFIPVAIVTLLLLLTAKDAPVTPDELLRYAGTVVSYWLFFQVLSIITVLISAISNTSKDALMKVLALWLFFIILLPKTTQALGSYFYPSPSKIEFETAVEKYLVKEGDSHNPDDPHYKALKDSAGRREAQR
jgi:ABC-2 type transport system permease protein